MIPFERPSQKGGLFLYSYKNDQLMSIFVQIVMLMIYSIILSQQAPELNE